MYSVQKVSYRDANKCRVEEFKPLDDIVILDTSALGHAHIADFVRFISRRGTVLIEEHVKRELDKNNSAEPGIRRKGPTLACDTRQLQRIYYNGRAILEALGNRVTVLNPNDETVKRERKICGILATALPKNQAYLLTRESHPEWYNTVNQALTHRETLGDPLEIKDLREKGSGIYALLNVLLEPGDSMTGEMQTQLGYLRLDRNRAEEAYRLLLRSIFGPSIGTHNMRDTTIENYFVGCFQKAVGAILLRMVGYKLDGACRQNAPQALREIDRRFGTKACALETDIHVVLTSYAVDHPPRKKVNIVSSDNDLRHLLELRQQCDQHADIRKRAYTWHAQQNGKLPNAQP